MSKKTEMPVRSGKKPVFRVEINPSACKGCGLCLAFCPTGCLVISGQANQKGLHYAEFSDCGCTGCRACALMCPDAAVRIIRRG